MISSIEFSDPSLKSLVGNLYVFLNSYVPRTAKVRYNVIY